MKVYELIKRLEYYPAGANVELRTNYDFIKSLVEKVKDEYGTEDDEIGINMSVDTWPVEAEGNHVVLGSRSGYCHWDGKLD